MRVLLVPVASLRTRLATLGRMQLDSDEVPADQEARPDSLQASSDSDSPTAPAPLEQQDQALQRQRVLQAIEEHDVDALRHLAGQTGGFVNQELRKRAWRVPSSRRLNASQPLVLC